MAQATYVGEGSTIDHTPVSDIAVGEVVVIGEFVGVARTEIKANALGSLAVEGVFDFAKESGGGVTFAAGAVAYWDNTNNLAVATDNSGANKRIGKVVVAAADADSKVRVRLDK